MKKIIKAWLGIDRIEETIIANYNKLSLKIRDIDIRDVKPKFSHGDIVDFISISPEPLVILDIKEIGLSGSTVYYALTEDKTVIEVHEYQLKKARNED